MDTSKLRKLAARNRPRVLVMCHNHPRYSNGGAEIAAHGLFEALHESGEAEAWFLGCNPIPGQGRAGTVITQPFGEREYIYATTRDFDWFRFANRDLRLPDELAALLRHLRPDVVHVHHYANLGVEILLNIRRTLPQAAIVATLHEYLAICHHFGQMVKRDRFTRCDQASPGACAQCFPELEPADFFLRESYIKSFFVIADQFIAPSEFLAQRYRAWGLDAARMNVIENIIAPAGIIENRPAALAAAAPLRVGYFGQISRLKGINVLLDAAAILAEQSQQKAAFSKISFEIHGDSSRQPEQFQLDFSAALAKAGRNVTFQGPYRQDQLDRLMRNVDVIVVPSIWWENSPLVIQEARRNKIPVICSDIGGMAEKIRDGSDGFHFPAGNPFALASLLDHLANHRESLIALRDSIAPPPETASVLEAHLMLYRKTMRGRVMREFRQTVAGSWMLEHFRSISNRLGSSKTLYSRSN